MKSAVETHIKRKGILFNLKENGVIQKVLINHLVEQKSYSIAALSCALQIDSHRLNAVLQGNESLDPVSACALVDFYYGAFNAAPTAIHA
jgi:hypothetical protein